MGDCLLGTWKLDRSENFDEFLKEMGVNFMIRKVAGTAKPSLTIEKNGDDWTLTTQAMKTQIIKFKLGEPFEAEEPTGGKSKGTANLDGDVLKIEATNDSNGKTVKVSREVVNGELVQTMDTGAIKCKRIYKKQ